MASSSFVRLSTPNGRATCGAVEILTTNGHEWTQIDGGRPSISSTAVHAAAAVNKPKHKSQSGNCAESYSKQCFRTRAQLQKIAPRRLMLAWTIYISFFGVVVSTLLPRVNARSARIVALLSALGGLAIELFGTL